MATFTHFSVPKKLFFSIYIDKYMQISNSMSRKYSLDGLLVQTQHLLLISPMDRSNITLCCWPLTSWWTPTQLNTSFYTWCSVYTDSLPFFNVMCNGNVIRMKLCLQVSEDVSLGCTTVFVQKKRSWAHAPRSLQMHDTFLRFEIVRLQKGC